MRVTKNILLISLIAVLLVLAGCSGKDAANENMKKNASEMTEKMLIGMNEDSYEKFSGDFDAEMKNSMPESKFKIMNPEIKGKIGNYISKEYVRSEKKDGAETIEYKGKFSGEKSDVVIQTVLSENNGRYFISSVWLNSPNLRKK